MSKKVPSFEESMQRLEQIVRTMERGEATLEESLKLFQEGTELIKQCGKQLEDAKLQVTMVTAGTDGTPKEERFQNDF